MYDICKRCIDIICDIPYESYIITYCKCEDVNYKALLTTAIAPWGSPKTFFKEVLETKASDGQPGSFMAPLRCSA